MKPIREASPEELAAARKIDGATAALLRSVAATKRRPSIDSDDWDRFTLLLHLGVVEDLGGGFARIRSFGRAVLRALGRGRG